MKNLFLITCSLCLFLSFSSKAQQYQYVPMDTPGNEWQLMALSPHSGPPHSTIDCDQLFRYIYILNQDTVINGDTYKVARVRDKLSWASVPYAGSTPCPFPGSDPTIASVPDYSLYIRESNKQVFIYKSWRSPIYDFNNLETKNGVLIDTVNIGNALRRRFIFEDGFSRTPDTVIEGIGSIRRGPQGISAQISHLSLAMVTCNTLGGNIVFNRPEAPCSVIYPYGTPTSVIEHSIAKQKVYPNPFSDVLHIETPTPVNIILYNGVGAAVQQLHIDKTTSVPVSGLPAGLYFIVLKDDMGKIVNTEKLVKDQ